MELEELGKSPISEANPVGEDVRFEPEFEELENEIGKLSSPTASEGVDWDKVIKLSQNILGEKSKNLLIACYLCIGLLKKDGLPGLASGVHILRELLETFWETMFPPVKRMKGRVNAVVWWSEKINEEIPNLKPEKWLKEKRDTLVHDLETLDSFLSEKIEEAPILRTMNASIAGLIEEEVPPAPPPPPETAGEEVKEEAKPEGRPASAAPVPQPSAPAQPAKPPEEVSDADAEKLLKQGLDILGRTATLFMNREQFNPIPFRLNRIVAWIPVRNLPPATDGKTLIPPPDGQVISSLKGMYQSQNWRDLVLAAESRVRQFLFWLDIHRFVAEGLEQLRYPVISQLVASETLSYVSRLPGIEKLSFSDGTPFADQETKEWLKTVAEHQGGGGDSSAGGGGGEIEKRVAHDISEAQNLIKENKVTQALNQFRDKLNQSASLRERFIWEIGLCRLLLRAKKPRLGIPYFHEILGALDTYKIEQWEPELALEGLTVVLSGLQLQDEKNRNEELIESVLNRISVLNPGRALEFL